MVDDEDNSFLGYPSLTLLVGKRPMAETEASASAPALDHNRTSQKEQIYTARASEPIEGP